MRFMSHLPWRGRGWRGRCRTRCWPRTLSRCRAGHSSTSLERRGRSGEIHCWGLTGAPGGEREEFPPVCSRRLQVAAPLTLDSPGGRRTCWRRWRWRAGAGPTEVHSSRRGGWSLSLQLGLPLCTVQYCTVLYFTVLYCTVLYMDKDFLSQK